MSTLYLVATPIGNLEDLSPRAQRILREAPCIACEDTRVTGKLLQLLGIENNGRLIGYHDFNKNIPGVLEKLAQGDVALVSDAGMPGINDPGYHLVKAARQAGHRIVPIPGPSAPVAALAASGLPSDAFLYLGYLPRKAAERRTLLESVRALPYTLIFLETPHRIAAALDDLAAVLGNRTVCLARELTKLHEEIITLPLDALREYVAAAPPRGEITLVVAGADPQAESWGMDRLQAAVREGLAAGEKPSALARRLAAESGHPRREIYGLIEASKGVFPDE
jgi:16S rRNA (cytidine1402-2'-O)-methyltransferase